MVAMLRFRPERPGAKWHKDIDGVPTIVIQNGASERVSIDISNEIAGTDTVASVAWSASGPVVSGESYDETTASATLTGSAGSAKITVTLASGRTIVLNVRVVVPPGGSPIGSDYDG
jgi:hypothetical protein